MDFGLSDEQILFKDTLRRFLAEQCPSTRVRSVMESDTGHDAALWHALSELGVAGLNVPAEYGGSGLELLDVALAAEEFGFAATPGPFLASAMAVTALVAGDDEANRATWLPRIASGDALAAVAIGEAGGEENAWSVGIERRALAVVDMTRRVDAINFTSTPVTRVGGQAALQRCVDAGCVLLAADASGGARRALDMALDYAKQREQFGRPIGGFQAVKHQLADMATELEPAISLWWYAAHAFDHIRDQSERHAALAKAHLSDVFERIVRASTEIHGGIGFTWEFDLQLWFRRAVFDRSYLGESGYHRARAADLAGW